MKSTLYGYRADVIGLLWLAVALFFSLTLASYYPLDPSFNSIGTFTQVRNKCGYLGSFLADILYQLFGLGAWVFVLLVLRQSMLAFQNKLFVNKGVHNAGILALSVLVSSSLLELHQPERSFFQGHIYPGGILGKMVIQNTLPYLHFAGLFLVFWSLALILFVLITKSSISSGFIQMVFALQKGGSRFAVILYSKGGRTLVQVQKICLAFLLSLFSFRKREKKREHKLASSLFSRVPLSKNSNKETPFFSNIAVKKDYFFKEEEKEMENDLEEKAGQESIQWKLPPADLLKASPLPPTLQMSLQESKGDAERLKRKLEQFSISGEITNIRSGPVITVFEFKPEDHVKVARITQMEDDLMIALKSRSIRIIAPIPGRDVVGIETAHTKRQMVYLKNMIKEPLFWQSEQPLPLVLGRHVDGRPAIKDLEKLPHLMVAGSTGSGKSVFIVSFLLSLLFRHTPESLRLLLVDPKQVDLSVFAGLPHLLTPPVRESKEAVVALQWCLSEMYKRYRSLARFHVRDLVSFNEKTKKLKEEEKQIHRDFTESLGENSEELYYFSPQPYICVVLEEFGDLMSSPDRNRIETLVVRLAQMARACGIHLILSMQSPRKDVVTGLIKTNIPGRMSFKVSSRIDSRIILDEGGAERLLSQGDMLYLGPGQARPERYHGAFVKETEVLSVVQFWTKQAKTDFCLIKNLGDENALHRNNEEISLEQDDNKYEEVFSYVSELKEVSASHLQRKYSLGYPRAARLIDRLEEEGIVGPARGSKPREVLIHK
ncbi:MAG: DNA translocase FtsK 4TM domain-containing protein [Bdellovibrionales bacterium]|nr:DNA translocase FtsK 4TM domain-containing protein [Bdellovibrionales bacterium]